MSGCPYPTRYEHVYGFNEIVVSNQSDRMIEAIFIVEEGQTGRGPNLVAQAGGLPPGAEYESAPLLNGIYRVEIEYWLTAEEAQGDPRRVVEVLNNIVLYSGETYVWYWYRPEKALLPAPVAA
jgi:hypothetical protein